MTRQVRSWAIAALAAFVLAGTAAPSFAGIIYNVTNATTVQDGYSLSGSIEVSGTGSVTSFSSYNFTATKAGNPTLTFDSGSGFPPFVTGVMIATDSALYLPSGSALGFEGINNTGVMNFHNNFGGSRLYNATLDFGDYTAWSSSSYPNTDVNGWQIGSVQAVPEPSTYCMALAGLACGGYSVLRRRKRA